MKPTEDEFRAWLKSLDAENFGYRIEDFERYLSVSWGWHNGWLHGYRAGIADAQRQAKKGRRK